MLREERARARGKQGISTLAVQNKGNKKVNETKNSCSPQLSLKFIEREHVNYVEANIPSTLLNFSSSASPPSKPIQSTTINGISYYSNWLTSKETNALKEAIYSSKQSKWVTLPTTGRKLQQWGGIPGSTNVHERGPFPLPSYQNQLIQRMLSEEIFVNIPNHTLINQYLPNQGILPHKDGPAYYPKVAIISIGQEVIMSFRKTLKDEIPTQSVILENGSLIVFEKDAYNHYLHNINDSIVDTTFNKNILNAIMHSDTGDRTTGGDKKDGENSARNGENCVQIIERTEERISLTIRYVPPSK